MIASLPLTLPLASANDFKCFVSQFTDQAALFRTIFERAVLKFLKGKTVVLALNQLHYLPYADRVLYLEKGKIIGDGRYDQLMKDKESEFAKMIAEHGLADIGSHTDKDETQDTKVGVHIS